MGRVVVEIKPFDADGDLESEYTDVTDRVVSIGKISNKIERDDYEIGIFTISNQKVVLRNNDGLFSDVDNASSIFEYKRDGSRLRIIWVNDDIPICGGAICGSSELNDAKVVFDGILNARSNTQNITEQFVTFDVVSYDYLLTQFDKPYYGDTSDHNIEDVVFDWLDNTVGTSGTGEITISTANWEFGEGNTFQFADVNEELTLKEALDDVIFRTNSVLYVKNQILYIKPRLVSETSQYTFNGPSVIAARENIININSIRDGENKIFNKFVWQDTALSSSDPSSINKYNTRQKEVSSVFFGSDPKKQTVLDNLKNEYATPRDELRVIAPLDNTVAELFLMDSVTIDYPQTFLPDSEGLDTYWDKFNWDEASWPVPEFDLIISTSQEWKIIGIDTDIINEIITFNLREI